LRRIQALGVHISFDEFGTGYASLTYLKKFSLDGLKIDQCFVRELRPNSDDAAIVGCMISLGRLLGVRVIAEGIETAAHGKAAGTNGLRRTTRLPFRPADASCGVRGSFPDEKRHAFWFRRNGASGRHRCLITFA
jgi:predicted signal transduction protein with EAL and GGDEF domain